jgi:hypothetical protein
MGVGKFDNEVDGDRLSFIGDFKREKFADRAVPLRLRAKAEVACATVLTNVARHLWPPV